LVADRAVAIAARPRSRSNTIVGAHCELGQSKIVARAFAQRRDSFLVHILTGTPECVVLLDCPRERLGELVFEELPGVRGLINTFTQPVLRHTHTISRWRPDVLTDGEVRALMGDRRDEPDADRQAESARDKADDLLLQALHADGRRSIDELSRLTGLSDTTVRRRVEKMRREGDLVIRAIVEPALLGLPVEAVLWVTATPTDVESVAQELGRSPFARYVSVLVGDRQIMAIVAMPSEAALYDFVTRGSWLTNVHSVNTAIILETYKRGGALTVTGT
jgi:DNA-binding Lrp family transcriptional regulator